MMGSDTPLPALPPQVYTDLGGLQNLGARFAGETGAIDKGAALAEVARQFESIMLGMMMKSMREANAVFGEGNPLSSSEMQFYQEMFDHQLTLSLAQSGGVGIAEVLERQLGAKAGLSQSQLQADAVSPAEVASRRRVADGSDNTVTFDGSPAAFIASVAPHARQAAGELGVDSRVLISQAALETGWGGRMLQRADGTPSYNFFNIKAGNSWDGAVVTVPTLEYRDGVAVREMAAFRSYQSSAEGFADYVRLIRDNPRYQEALQRAGDPRHYMQALADAGYATDPQYANKVLAVLASDSVQANDSL